MTHVAESRRPLSQLQLALIRREQANDTAPVRWASSTLSCHLPWNPPRLSAAVEAVARDHPAISAVFDLAPGGTPRQVVRSSAGLPLHHHDLRQYSTARQQHLIADALAAGTADTDIDGSALAQVFAHRVGEEVFRLSLLSHPALLDRWSHHAWFADVLRRYLLIAPPPGSGPVSAPADPLPDPTAAQLAARAAAFTGFSPSPPSFWITEPESSFGPVADAGPLICQAFVEEGLAHRLASLAQHLGIPLKQVVLTAHAKAVGAGTGRTDVTVGVETPCWQAPGPRPLDQLTNVVAMRLRLPANSWDTLIGQVAAETAAAQSYLHLPPALLHNALRTDRLLDSTFSYSETAIEADLLDGAAGTLAPLAGHEDCAGESRTPFEGSFLAEVFRGPFSGRMLLRLTAGPGLTTAQLREILRIHLEVLSHCAAQHEPHHFFTPLTDRQRQLTLHQWNGPERRYPVEQCVHELIEQQVRKTPYATAVVDAERTLTYRELNADANRLAHRLRAARVSTGSVVGVYAKRSASLLTGFLAVLKAGAAYLPLDPQQPAERTAYMLKDAGTHLVLSDSTYADALPCGSWSVWNTDQLPDRQFPDHDVPGTCSTEDLMYVIYTSGSTGRPKGVAVPHRGIANYLGWCAEAYARHGSGGTAVFSSVAFDMVVPNIYTPLVTGQRVCILDERLNMFAVAERLRGLAPFSFLKLTPGQLEMLSELLSPEQAQSLAGTLAVGADAFSVRTLRHWRRIDPRTPVLNEYGPTEASVGNCVHFIDDTESGDLVPIGRPIPNTTMYVLDDMLAPLPVGVPGELYIGGDCVVRGYINRPDLTEERFVTDPFSERPGARMYRTGDIGRWLPGGVLDFLGRIDSQLKIRGYRVEPAEVEAALAEHPSISEAVVSPTGTTRETLSLVGYYVAEHAVGPEEIRTYLGSRLPEYLIPSFLVPIDAVPLNANGKVDRPALPAPGRHQSHRARQQAAVRGPQGQAVRRIWNAVFGTGKPALDDPITRADHQLAGEVQLAVQLAETTGLQRTRAFRLVASARTFGELCEQLSREAARPSTSGTRTGRAPRPPIPSTTLGEVTR
ncbi:amino acid adenylation domain-containing protein [Streptomyces sp. NPDC056061]|uniref:non-ribosomal peptide synthetase n=1 Tax=Streptomyces sp. NPDC056061 TaxID=3345700 RepID=UPI0035DBAB58